MTAGLYLLKSVLVVSMLSLALGLARPASAGGGVLCSDPYIFTGSDVNTVVLPYSLSPPDEQFRQRTVIEELSDSRIARKLSVLMQLDTLYALSYPAGMGVVHVIPDQPDCQAKDVLARVRPMLRDGKGLIMLWGNFLEDGEQIYVQTYLRFLRRDRSESIAFTPPGQPGLKLNGRPAQQAFGFGPRLLSEDDIAALEEAFAEASKIYEDSQSDRVKGRLELSPTEPFGYYVTAIDPETGRMRVRPHDSFPGPEGWIAARANPSILLLRQKLPEMAFVDAVAGYLAARIIENDQQDSHWAGPWRARLESARRRSQARFADYRNAVGADEDKSRNFDERAAVALSFVLSGMLDLLTINYLTDEGEQAKRLDDATMHFAGAQRLLPFEAEGRNLLAISRAGAIEFDRKASGAAIQDWSNALSLDPGNEDIARNLARLYDLLLDTDPDASGLSEAELRARRASLAAFD